MTSQTSTKAGHKPCSSCGKVKSLEEFRKQVGCPRGIGVCKSCKAAAARENYRNNKESRKHYIREWQRRNRLKQKLYRKTYAMENKEAVRVANSNWRRRNYAKCRSYCAKRTASLLERSVGDRRLILKVYEEAASNKKINCRYCGRITMGRRERHVDHLIPISRGGNHEAANLCIACSSCNLRKGTKTPEEFAGAME